MFCSVTGLDIARYGKRVCIAAIKGDAVVMHGTETGIAGTGAGVGRTGACKGIGGADGVTRVP